MRDDQIRSLLRRLEEDREPDPAFSDALFDRLTMVARTERRSRMPMLLLVAALLAALAASIAIGSQLIHVPLVVELPASPTPGLSTPAAPSSTPTAASPTATASQAPSAAPSAPAQVAELSGAVLQATADGLRLRAAPSEEADIVATLRAGQRMGATGRVTSADGLDWYEVGIGPQGVAGWITSGPQGDWLRLVEDGRILYFCDGCGAGVDFSVAPSGDLGLQALGLPEGFTISDWSPDGTRLAATFQPPDPAVAPNVVVMGPDGSDQRELGPGYRPLWSPDGSRLTWTVDDDVVVTDANLVPSELGIDLLGPSVALWSSDGTRLAIHAAECPECTPGEPVLGDVPGSIYVIDADGTDLVRLTDPNYDTITGWSPDGSEIAFSRTDLSGTFPLQALTVAVSAGERTEVVRGEELYGGYQWSPDGGRVAFRTNEAIVVQRADGGGQPTMIVPEDLEFVSALQWSPSGRYLVYETTPVTSASKVWIVRADGSEPPRPIVPDGGNALAPHWQPVLAELP